MAAPQEARQWAERFVGQLKQNGVAPVMAAVVAERVGDLDGLLSNVVRAPFVLKVQKGEKPGQPIVDFSIEVAAPVSKVSNQVVFNPKRDLDLVRQAQIGY